MTLAEFLSHHRDVWIQLPEDTDHWYPASAADALIPPDRLSEEVFVTREIGLDAGHAWIGNGTGYRWAVPHDRPTPFAPQPCPWPPLE